MKQKNISIFVKQLIQEVNIYMNNQFSQRVSDILVYSKEEANRLDDNYIGPGHLLLGLLREGEGRAITILHSLHVNLQNIKSEIENQLSQVAGEQVLPFTDGANITLNNEASKVLKLCILEARKLKEPIADTEHMLLAILKFDNMATRVLNNMNVYYDTVIEQIMLKPDIKSGMGLSQEEDEDEKNISPSNGSRMGNSQTQTKQNNNTPVIDNFGIDMTAAAMEGKLDPVVGREKEIERVAQILSRRKKNNPILIGNPGVGKSAIVEGLALRIVQKKVSRILFDKRVIALDMTSVVAGTKYRGQFEERIRSILNELQKNPNIILFIDEIHTIVGAGSTPGSMDAANMLKPALARGELQCIGATTLDEYRNSIEKDGALERRFQKIIVEPTSSDETLCILKNIKDKYEEHHNVSYTDAALEACVKLTERYVSDRFFPDKAIDALDEAGARVHLHNINVPKNIEEQEKLVAEAQTKKNEAVKQQNFELAASYRDQEKELEESLESMKLDWEKNLKENRETVDETQIADVVSMITGIPVQRMAQSEESRLKDMKSELLKHIIDQDTAVEKLVKAILRSRVGLKDPNKPIGTFLFLGPTGVGKTQLAKELAKFMFGTTDALIRIDMSEYMEKFTVSRLVGAPPGYVGYEEGGQLTEQVRRKPYSIVLLDEIEKAHPDVFNLLLQVMDEGRLTDSTGRYVDFKNTVIIMTSNIGTKQLKEFGNGIGFTSGSFDNNKTLSRSIIQKALNKTFAPEFINRLDEIITFDQLNLDAIIKIADIELSGVVKRINTLGYHIQITDEAKRGIAAKGYDVQFGARPLKRAIQNYVEDGIAEKLVNETILSGETILLDWDKEKDNILISIEK